MALSNVKIYYFPKIQGRAGAPRALAHATGVAFENVLWSFAEFGAQRFSDKAPTGSLPTVTFTLDGAEHTLTQSNAQLLFFARHAKRFLPDSPLEYARAIELLDACEDAGNLIAPTLFEKDEDKRREMREALGKEGEGRLWRWLQWLDGRLGVGPFAAGGDTLSVADFKLYFTLSWFASDVLDNLGGRRLCAATKHVLAYLERVKATPEMSAYLKYWDGEVAAAEAKAKEAAEKK